MSSKLSENHHCWMICTGKRKKDKNTCNAKEIDNELAYMHTCTHVYISYQYVYLLYTDNVFVTMLFYYASSSFLILFVYYVYVYAHRVVNNKNKNNNKRNHTYLPMLHLPGFVLE